MFKRIDTLFLQVRNLDKAVNWYSEHLGLSWRWKTSGYACLNVGETPITLVEAGGEFRPTAYPAFNFYAADIDETYRKLRAAGVQVDAAIQESPGMRWFDLQDLDGNRFGVCWFPER